MGIARAKPLRRRAHHATTARVTIREGDMPGTQLPQASESGAVDAAGHSFSQDWQAMRDNAELQFAPVTIPDQAPPPDWWLNFLKWLGEVMAPVARALVISWPVLKWVLLAMLVAAICLFLYRMIDPGTLGFMRRRKRSRELEEWAPEQAQAIALLDEADRLAAEGRFDEATHLLLQRSVGQIAAARPELVEPSSTAREIAAEPRLPETARTAFAIIAERVERSLFALRALSAEDWHAARAAYADFALARPGAAA